MCKDIAEQLEKQEEFDACVEFYTKAADLFLTEDSTSEANKCRLKIAEFVAKAGKYQQAVEVDTTPASTPSHRTSLSRSMRTSLARQWNTIC